jgi:hypothetical protein
MPVRASRDAVTERESIPGSVLLADAWMREQPGSQRMGASTRRSSFSGGHCCVGRKQDNPSPQGRANQVCESVRASHLGRSESPISDSAPDRRAPRRLNATVPLRGLHTQPEHLQGDDEERSTQPALRCPVDQARSGRCWPLPPDQDRFGPCGDSQPRSPTVRSSLPANRSTWSILSSEQPAMAPPACSPEDAP